MDIFVARYEGAYKRTRPVEGADPLKGQREGNPIDVVVCKLTREFFGAIGQSGRLGAAENRTYIADQKAEGERRIADAKLAKEPVSWC